MRDIPVFGRTLFRFCCRGRNKTAGQIGDPSYKNGSPSYTHKGRVPLGSLAAVAALAALAAAPARADLVLSVQPETTLALPGSTGNAFDVTLSNTGPGAVSIASFSFGLSVASPDIVFTEVNTSTTVPYLFGSDSLFGPVISTTPPPAGQTVAASDLYTGADLGVTVSSRATFGLGHVLFDVLPTATPGPVPISFDTYPTTSLTDPNGNDIPITTLDSSAAIDIAPEPSSLVLFCGLGITWLLAAGRGREFILGRGPRKAPRGARGNAWRLGALCRNGARNVGHPNPRRCGGISF